MIHQPEDPGHDMPHRVPPPLVRLPKTASLLLPCVACAGLLLFVACAREPVAPAYSPWRAAGAVTRAELAPPVAVGVLLDSFSLGGVYKVLPRGGYAGGSYYARSPEKEQYAGTVSSHPTGLELPVGLPVRILAAGSYTSRQTAAFQSDYCASHASDSICVVASFAYTVHGLADGPGVSRPYEPGMGLALTWSRTAGYSDRFYGVFPNAEFFRGRVPALDTATLRELHFRRNGCCYYNPSWRTPAWETYEGSWRFGAVPDDGGQAELGVPAVLRVTGPRTDAPMAAPATFGVATTTGEAVTGTRWWYVRAANNTFDGEPVPLVTITQPWTMQIPRYPDGQRTVFEALASCAGQSSCAYQPSAAGAVVVQATLTDGRVLAARNTGARGARVKITADSATLTYGDTTVFRVTAPGASEWRVTGYEFVPLPAAPVSALWAVRENAALRVAEQASGSRDGTPKRTGVAQRAKSGPSPEIARLARPRRPTHYRDAEFSCDVAAVDVCYNDPQVTGYEVVTARVDGEMQRDSVLVTLLPGLLVSCTPSAPVRRTAVHCVASMSDSSDFILTRLRSSISGTTIVDTVMVGGAVQTSYDWSGPALVTTKLEFFAVSRGDSVRGRTSFSVVRDTRRFRDVTQSDPPEQRRARGRPILSASYPGMIRTDSGWTILEGGLGHTWHLWPDYTLDIVRHGPNRGLVYADTFSWFDPRPGGPQATSVAAGTYLSVALFPEDPFYRLQRGGGDHCTAPDIEVLRQDIYAHEVTHYRRVIALRLQLDLHITYESTAILSRDSSISPAIELAFNRPTAAYFKSMRAIDSLIDLYDRATTSITCDMRFP